MIMKRLNTVAVVGAVLGLSLLAAAAQPQAGPRGPRPGMQPHPPGPPAVIAAIDANHDGVIDAAEIANATAALQSLDKNADGQLTADEFLGGPPPGEGPRGPLPKELLEKYDTDQDGKLNETEREALHADIQAGKVQPPPAGRNGPKGPPPPELLQKYDVDKDGQLSPDERQALDKDVQEGKVPRPPRPPRGPGFNQPVPNANQ